MSLSSQTFSRTNLREWAFTIDKRAPGVVDHIYQHSPLLAILTGKGLGQQFGSTRGQGSGAMTVSGGESLTIRVRLGTHSGAKRATGGFDTHTVSPDDNVRVATANLAFYNHAIVVSQHDLDINKGDAAIASFLDDQTESVFLALADYIADDLHATSAAANGLTPVDDLISANDSVQSLSGATYTNYNSRGLSARGTAPGSVSFTSGSFAAQGLSDLRTLTNNASDGMIEPDVHITDYATHERYEGAIQPQERYARPFGTGDAGFMGLAFRTKPVLPDPKTSSGAWYALKIGGRDGLKFETLSGNDFDFDEWKPSSNQRAMVRPLAVTGQLVIGDRRRSNKMTSITD